MMGITPWKSILRLSLRLMLTSNGSRPECSGGRCSDPHLTRSIHALEIPVLGVDELILLPIAQIKPPAGKIGRKTPSWPVCLHKLDLETNGCRTASPFSSPIDRPNSNNGNENNPSLWIRRLDPARHRKETLAYRDHPLCPSFVISVSCPSIHPSSRLSNFLSIRNGLSSRNILHLYISENIALAYRRGW
jgi:hypothetical protein